MREKRLWISLGVVAAIIFAVLKLSIWHRASYEIPVVRLADDFQISILKAEASLPLVPGTNKTFQWRSEDKKKTRLAIVQIHGFSATRREIAPVPERLAEVTGSNLFMTRLSGHGLGSVGMLQATPENLLRDAEEALQVGLRMGERVVLLGVSTGATLALEMAARHPKEVAGLILVSPNFRPSRAASLLLQGPIGKWVAEYYYKEHRWQARSEDEGRFWTTTYSALAVHQMMDLLSFLNRRDLKEIKVPAVLFSSDRDLVVSTDLIRKRMATYGGPLEIEEIKGADHVLVGDIKSPGYNDTFLKRSAAFVNSLKK